LTTSSPARRWPSACSWPGGWLAAHNDAVMAVLFLVFGVDLISKGLAG
jgi:hypothetical protein